MKLRPVDAFGKAVREIETAARAQKCLPCGCLRDSLAAIARSSERDPEAGELTRVCRRAQSRLGDRRYDCLGCDPCHPAVALNVLNELGGGRVAHVDVCPTDGEIEARPGWPPLPGDYQILRFSAPVAICALTDDRLREKISLKTDSPISIVGALRTENLGIERLFQNVLSNPNIRFLIVCGLDSLGAVGHLPGQSLVSLAKNGVDDRMRIVGARGKRPVLRNVSPEAVERFRALVEVVDLVGEANAERVLDVAGKLADRDPGPAAPFDGFPPVPEVKGYLPDRMTPDPNGYFVVQVDRRCGRLVLEHYRNDGVLGVLMEGSRAVELFAPAVDRGLISRLDHAAYLGRELERAERALLTGEAYIQDGAPETRAPGDPEKICGPCC